MIVVLVAASGASWEPRALAALGDHRGTVVLKRCMDVDDLLAAASSGQADVAVVALDAPGLDQPAVDHLLKHGVRPVAVVAAEALEAGRVQAGRLGISVLVRADEIGSLPDAVTAADATQPAGPPDGPRPGADPSAPTAPAAVPLGGPGSADEPAAGRIVAVWGPAGSPGRSTVAVGLAARLARRGQSTLLVDADPYAASIAQQLGIMDEVSGLLAAARLATSGQLEERLDTVQRSLDARLTVVTGLPRPDRWTELRAGTVEHLLELGRDRGQVVVADTGFSLEEEPVPDFGVRPPRNQLTLGAIEVADEVLVVGAADPVGLSRLARGLTELRERAPMTPVRVVVNRMRPSLVWSEKEIAAMVSGFARLAGLHFLPDDQAGVDRALVAGRTPVETGDSAFARALAPLADAVHPPAPAGPAPTAVRRRTAGTAPRR